MRVLVCGSRDWDDERIIRLLLQGLNYYLQPGDRLVVIEGGASGADAEASILADGYHWGHEQFPADWETHGKAAGPIRNQRMLDEGKPDVVVAFKDGFQRDRDDPNRFVRERRGGTEDMVRRAKAAGIPVYIVSHG